MKATFPEVSKLALTRPPAGRVGASLGSAGPALGPQGGQRQSRSEARPAARPGPAEVVSPAVSPPRPAVPDCPPARRAGLPAGCPGARFENCCRQSPRGPGRRPGRERNVPRPQRRPGQSEPGRAGSPPGSGSDSTVPSGEPWSHGPNTKASQQHVDQKRFILNI